jgi:hypothetical protein
MLLRISNVAIVGAAIFWIAIFTYAVLIGRSGLYRAIPLGIGLMLLAGLRLPPLLKINLGLGCLGVVVALYGAEMYLTLFRLPKSVGHFSRPFQAFDSRSPLQVVSDFRRSGIDAHSNLFGRLPLVYGQPGLMSGKDAILPLGGISGRTTVLCNEAGNYISYVSDEHGFNNPKGLWSRERISVAILGDSFAQGVCVPAERTIAGLVRKRYPSTLNLGMSGSGPLLELAALQEYLLSTKPRTVLWLFFDANDLVDLGDERSSPLLKKYLENDFHQGLLGKQPVIDRAWAEFATRVQSEWEQRERSMPMKGTLNWINDLLVEHRNRTLFARVLRLRELRLGLAARLSRPEAEEHQIAMLGQILQHANQTVASWGGTLHFVFLPGMELLSGRSPVREHLARRVLEKVRELGIASIDIRRSFASHNIASLFYYPDSHYNETGNRIVAEAVISVLEEEKIALGTRHPRSHTEIQTTPRFAR